MMKNIHVRPFGSMTDFSDETGFTLMVYVVILAVLTILIVVMAPMMMDVDSNEWAAKAQVSSFMTALKAYKIKFEEYPSQEEGLSVLINNSKNQNFLDAAEVPKDPWGNEFVYTYPGTHGEDFNVVSYGADGVPGGSGWDADIESWNLKGST